jgi:outer membrane protein assembly factor BamB
MIGQGPEHPSRSLSKTTPSASPRSWALSLGEVLYASPVIAADGTIYAATEHALHAVSSSGIEKWSLPIQYPAAEPPSPAIGPDGTVYVSSGLALEAIHPDGTQKWAVQFPSGVLSSPTIIADGTIYVATSDGGLVALSPDGSIKALVAALPPDASWRMSRFSTPAVAADGTLWVRSWNEPFSDSLSEAVTLWLAPNGMMLNYYLAGYPTLQAYPTTSVDGATYVSGSSGLDARDAAGNYLWQVVWSFTSETMQGNFSNLAASANGTVYIALHGACALPRTGLGPCVTAYYADGTMSPTQGVTTGVTAFDASGRVDWTFATGANVWIGSLSVASDGTLYAAGSQFYRLGEGGKVVGMTDLASPCISPIAIDDDGIAVFGTADGNLYAR